MTQKEIIYKIIYKAIDMINLNLPADQQIEKKRETSLSGSASNIDSLSILNLLVAIEEQINQEWETTIELVDERIMSQEKNPLVSVETLSNYIASLLEKDSNV